MSRAWTYEQLIFDVDQYYEDIIRGIDSAKTAVAFESYIFEDDPIGHFIEDALIRSAKRGVNVRLLVDGIGARQWLERRARHLASKGVEVRVYHPVKIYETTSRFFRRLNIGHRAWERSRFLFERLNRRNHRKLVIVDNRKAWVGSLNVTSSHKTWRDTAVSVEGPALSALINGFDHAYSRAHLLDGSRAKKLKLVDRRRALRSAVVRQNFTLKQRRRGYHEFLRRIGKARRRIWITNAYLAPSGPVIKALMRAGKRGVDVRILVPRKSDVFFMPWVAGTHYPKLLGSGVRIFEYLPRFLHAKSVLIDHWATVGTSNLNGRSLRNDLEVDIVVRKRKTIRELSRQFLIDLKNAEEIFSERRTFGQKLNQRFASAVGRFILWLMREWI